MEIIKVDNVEKYFRGYKVLDSVNLSCESGSITGIVGNNGSGKSVLFKCLCGFYQLDRGVIYINGKKKNPNSILKNAGVIIEAPAFLERYSGYKNLAFLYGINHKVDKSYIYSVMEKVGLSPTSRKRVSRYSMGMKQRLAIAQAIMEENEIIILDEPMNGLDKNGVIDMRKLFLDLREQGKTILLASHNREDIEVLCDHVYEMEKGVLNQIR